MQRLRDELIASYEADLRKMKAAGTVFVSYANVQCTDGHLAVSVTLSVVPAPDTRGQDVYEWLAGTFSAESGVLDVSTTRLPGAGRAVQAAGEEPSADAVSIPGVDLSEAGPLTYLRTIVPVGRWAVDLYCCATFTSQPEQPGAPDADEPLDAVPDAPMNAGDMPEDLRDEIFAFFQTLTATLEIPAVTGADRTPSDGARDV